MVDDYTTKFHQVISHKEIQETKDQLVSRYIGVLRVIIYDTVYIFDPVDISAMHQRTLLVEK